MGEDFVTESRRHCAKSGVFESGNQDQKEKLPGFMATRLNSPSCFYCCVRRTQRICLENDCAGTANATTGDLLNQESRNPRMERLRD